LTIGERFSKSKNYPPNLLTGSPKHGKVSSGTRHSEYSINGHDGLQQNGTIYVQGQKLYTMAELLEMQERDLTQSRQDAREGSKAGTQGRVPLQPGEHQEHSQHHHNHAHLPAATACQQQADTYALQQGMAFAAQHQHQQPNNCQVAAQTRFPAVPNAVPLAPGVERIDPTVVFELIKRGGCVLVDLRGEDRSCGTIEGAVHVQAIDSVPFAAKVLKLVKQWSNEKLIIFHCQYSAHRAPQCANWYRDQAARNQRVAVMDGGFRGWEATGLPVISGAVQPPHSSSPQKPQYNLQGAMSQPNPRVQAVQQGVQMPRQMQEWMKVQRPHYDCIVR
jgi:rhodanese-related sulfurtransferase